MASEEAKQIQIERCPNCTQAHTFSLTIQRVIVMGLSDNQARQKTVTVIFTCPITSQQFEADLTLDKAPQERILSVRVGNATV